MGEVAVAQRVVQLRRGDTHRDHEDQVEEELERARRAVRLARIARPHRVQSEARGVGVRGHGDRIAAARDTDSSIREKYLPMRVKFR